MKTIYDLGFRECRWPICATGGEHQFCAEMTEPGDVYCPEHTRLAVREDQRVDANLKRLGRKWRGPMEKHNGTVRGPLEDPSEKRVDLVELFEGARL